LAAETISRSPPLAAATEDYDCRHEHLETTATTSSDTHEQRHNWAIPRRDAVKID